VLFGDWTRPPIHPLRYPFEHLESLLVAAILVHIEHSRHDFVKRVLRLYCRLIRLNSASLAQSKLSFSGEGGRGGMSVVPLRLSRSACASRG
jgi:hypothetical protein